MDIPNYTISIMDTETGKCRTEWDLFVTFAQIAIEGRMGYMVLTEKSSICLLKEDVKLYMRKHTAEMNSDNL
jgi:hypothetical protein